MLHEALFGVRAQGSVFFCSVASNADRDNAAMAIATAKDGGSNYDNSSGDGCRDDLLVMMAVVIATTASIAMTGR